MIRRVQTKGAHWIIGNDEDDIIRIAIKYNISYPMGRETNKARITGPIDFVGYYKIRQHLRSFQNAGVFYEENGELRRKPIKEVYKEMTEAENV